MIFTGVLLSSANYGAECGLLSFFNLTITETLYLSAPRLVTLSNFKTNCGPEVKRFTQSWSRASIVTCIKNLQQIKVQQHLNSV